MLGPEVGSGDWIELIDEVSRSIADKKNIATTKASQGSSRDVGEEDYSPFARLRSCLAAITFAQRVNKSHFGTTKILLCHKV